MNKPSSVDIIIQASDRASEVFKDVVTATRQLSTDVTELSSRTSAFGQSILALSGSSLLSLGKLHDIFNAIKQALDTEVGKNLLTDLEANADAAINTSQKLTDILGSVKTTGNSFLEGFLGTQDINTKIANKTKGIAEDVVSDLREKVESFSGGLLEKIFGENIPKSLNGEKLTKILTEPLLDFSRRLDSNDIGTGLASTLSWGLNQFISSQLPAGVREINEAMNGGLVSTFMPDYIKTFTEAENIFDGLEKVLERVLRSGFQTGFESIDSVLSKAEKPLDELGELLAVKLKEGVSSGFSGVQFSSIATKMLKDLPKSFDFLSENLRNVLSDLAEEFSPSIANALKGLDKPIQSALSLVFGKVFSSSSGGGLFKPIKEKFFESIKAINSESDGLLTDIGAELGLKMGKSFSSGFSREALKEVGQVANAIDDAIVSSVDFVGSIPEKLSSPLDGVFNVFSGVAGFGEPVGLFRDLQGLIGSTTSSILNATQELAFFGSGLSTLQQLVAGGPFDWLIGQNVRLREQLLATQSSLVATNKVMIDGQAVLDPTVAIQAMDAPINEAIAKIRQGSLDLVGVTSGQLIESFQIISGQASQIGISLSEASDLTLSFAATMGTLGIPLYQARQEITSIATGTIDMNSVLAKSLGITNQMVGSWKAQGTVFENLQKKMEAFKAGNALAAKTISGVTSNVQEVFEEIGRKAGEPLLDPIVEIIDKFYQFLKVNADSISAEVEKLVKVLFDAGLSMFDALTAVFQSISGLAIQIPDYLFTSLANGVTAFASAIKSIIPIVQPAINVLTELSKNILVLGGPFLKIALQAKVLQMAVMGVSSGFGTLTQALPFTGELLFFLKGRSNGLINIFSSLSKQIGFGAAGFLLLGKHIQSVPGAVQMLTGKFGSLGGTLASAIPIAARFGISIAGLSRTIPALGTVTTNLVKSIPSLVGGLANVVSQSDFAGGAFQALAPDIANVAKSISRYSDNIDSATFMNAKFAGVVKMSGTFLRQQMISFGLLGAGVFAALFVFDKFILNNKNFMKTLEKLDQMLKSFGSLIYGFLTNPFTVAIAVVTGLGVAIKAGLIPLIVTMANTFLVDAGKAVTSWAEKASQGFSSFSEGIRKTSIQTTAFFGNTESQLRKQTSDLSKELASQAEEYENAIARRTTQIEVLNQQIDEAANRPAADPENPFTAPAPDTENLTQQKKAVEDELNEIVAAREKQVQKLSQMQADVAKLAPPPTVGQRFSKLGDTIQTFTLGSMEKLKVATRSFSWQSVTTGFAGMAAGAKTAGLAITTKLAASFKALWASMGPMLLMVGAVVAVTEAIGTYSTLTEASTKNTKAYSESIQEATDKLNALKLAQGKSVKEEGDKTRSQERLEEIKKEQGFLTKMLDGVRRLANFVNNVVNPLRILSNLFGIINAVFEIFTIRIQQIPVLGNMISALGTVLGNVFKPAIQFIQPFLDKLGQLKNGIGGVFKFLSNPFQIDFGSAQLDREIVGYSDMLTKAEGDLNKFKETTEEVNAERKKMLDLQNQQAAARANGDEEGAKALQGEIDKTKELLDARNAQVDATIEALEKQKAPTDAQAKAQAELIQLAKDLKSSWEDNATIKPPDLARMGTATEQISAKAKAALEDFKKMSLEGGDAAQFKQKAQELLDFTQKQQEAGAITSQEAIARYKLLAENTKLDQEVQVKAQQAISAAYKAEGENQVAEVQRKQSEVDALTAAGKMGEAAAEKKMTELKKEELEARLAALKKAYEKEQEMRYQALANEMAAQDDLIAAAQAKMAEPGAQPSEIKAQQDIIDSATAAKLAAQSTYNNARAKADQKYQQESQSINTELAKNEAEAQKNANEERLKDYEEAQTQLEAMKAQGLTTDEQYAKSSLDITQNRLQEELDQIEAQRKKLDPKDTQGLQVLATKEAAIRGEMANSRNQYYDKMIAAAKADAEEQAAILESQKMAGLMTENEFNQKSFNASAAALDAEAKMLEEKRKQLKAGDIEGQEAVAAQQADVQKRRIQLSQNFYKKQQEIADRARKKLLDAAQAAETESEIQIQDMLNAGTIRKEDAEMLKLNATQERVNAELELEQQKLAELEAIPPYSDPEAEDARQQQIRDSRQKTHELTLTIAQTEGSRQEAIREKMMAALERQVQAQSNAIESQTQSWAGQATAIDNINRSLELQGKILEARRNYQEARNNMFSAELDTLSKLGLNAKEQEDVAKLKASIEIKTLEIKQQGELAALKLQQEQTANALKREEIENRIAQLKNQAEVAQRTADLQKLEMNPQASAEEKEAARLSLQASIQSGSALSEAGNLISNQRQAQAGLFQNELAATMMRQRGERVSARGNLVETLSGGERTAAAQSLRNQILRDLGAQGMGGLGAMADSMAAQAQSTRLNRRIPRASRFEQRTVKTAESPVSTPPKSSTPQSLRLPAPVPPRLQRPSLSPSPLPPINLSQQRGNTEAASQMADNSRALTGAVAELKTAIEAIGQINFSQENQINNTFSGGGDQAATSAASATSAAIIDALHDVSTRLRRH